MIYPPSFENIIGFDVLRTWIENHCQTKAGAELARRMQLLDKASQVEKSWSQIEEWIEINTGKLYDFSNLEGLDYLDFLGNLQVENNFLQEFELFILAYAVNFLNDTSRFFAKNPQFTQLAALFAMEHSLHSIPTEINKIIATDGSLHPYASAEYGKLGTEIKKYENQLRSIVNRIYSACKAKGYTAETDITVRDDKMLIPIIAEYKRKVDGFVHDISATGKIIYIEPTETVEINNLLKQAILEQRRERIKILINTTNKIRPHKEELLQLMHVFAALDFVGSKAKLCTKIEAQKPQIDSTELHLNQAVNPLLWWNKIAPKSKVVPFNLVLQPTNRILLISGPNAGGKSVVLKTTLLCAYMAQLGLLIPAHSSSKICLFNHYMAECGDGQNIESGLSTFSAHLQSLNAIVNTANSKTLVGIDEIATGTDPVFAIPIGRAVLETLLHANAYGIATTHYGKLKNWAHNQSGIRNAGMEYDTQKLEPLFKLNINIPGQSYAPELMKKSNFHAPTSKRALQLINTKELKEETLITELEQKEQQWNKLIADSSIKQLHLDKIITEYQALKEQIFSQKTEILNQAKREANRLLQGVNRDIENTIKSIKESQANKKVTQEKRQELKNQITKRLSITEKNIPAAKPILEETTLHNPTFTKIEEGSIVKNAHSGVAGEVIEIKKDKALVAFGIVKMWIPLEQLEINTQVQKNDHTSKFKWVQRSQGFNAELDLRGGIGQESVQIAEKWLEEAYALGYKNLRIIHGHGTGVLRKLIRDMLRSKTTIKNFAPEKPEQGGNGATVIELL